MMLLVLLACHAEPGGSTDADGTTGETAADTATPEAWCADPASTVTYVEVGAAMGLVDTTSADPGRKEHPPVAFADLDGDGDDDVLLGDLFTGLWLHRNDGYHFTVTSVDTVTELETLALTDLDGDRDLDLFAGGKVGGLRLYENDGGVFVDVSAAWGLAGVEVSRNIRDGAFGDYDGDGDPDLYVVTDNNGDPSDPLALHRLFRHDASTFTDVSDLIPAEGRAGLGWQATWFDLDLDRDLDLYVANADQRVNGPSRLFRNQGADAIREQFLDFTESCTCGYTGSNMGTSPADLDGDGLVDLFVTNTGPSPLLRNDGLLGFVDVAVATGATAVPNADWMTFGSAAFDHDNDGDLDLYAATGPLYDRPGGNQLPDQPDVLLDASGGLYTDVAAALGLADVGAGRGVAVGNLDGDGFPDLLVSNLGTPSRLYRATCTAARALVVELDGPAPNRFGIGARVEVETDAGVLTRDVGTKPGWAAAAHPRAWFGLGEARVVSVTVRWPDGVDQAVDISGYVDRAIVVTRE
ncbi:MAG: CRTAC1 family protein [Myxococcota bacterium]